MPRRLAALAIAVALVAAALAAWGFWLGPASLRVRERTLEIPRWPAGLAGTRVAVLSDFHVGSPFNGLDKLRRIVELTNESRPDLILLAGDFVITDVLGGSPGAPEAIARRLGELHAPLGVWAVLGNHDWWVDAPRVRAALERSGVQVLEDDAERVGERAVPFWIAGVSDFWEGPHDVEAALDEIPTGASILILTHNPDIFPSVPRRVALTVAGHTHGGQVRLPVVGSPVVPSKYGQRYAIGHVVEGDRHLFVTGGLGTSILPVRLGVPPEITILELHPLGRPPSLSMEKIRSGGGQREDLAPPPAARLPR